MNAIDLPTELWSHIIGMTIEDNKTSLKDNVNSRFEIDKLKLVNKKFNEIGNEFCNKNATKRSNLYKSYFDNQGAIEFNYFYIESAQARLNIVNEMFKQFPKNCPQIMSLVNGV